MLTYELAKQSAESLYVQLYRCIRHDIEQGILGKGEQLPSKRALAQHLGVSLITVEGAFRQLIAEGYVRTEPRRGSFVCAVSAPASIQKPDASTTPQEQRESTDDDQEDASLLADLTGVTPPVGLFPYAAWARTMRTVLSTETERTMLEAAGAQGSVQLRRAIAQHLKGFRGMDVHPDQVVIGSGAQSLYGLVVQLLGRTRTFAIEDPGYPRLRQIYQSNDVIVQTVRLDEHGPVLDELERTGASVLHCMPSHQFPTGLTTPVGRRQCILQWAANSDGGLRRYVIEDDFDCEFRMAGRPIPALSTMDAHERVIYANTFTKTLGAAFRIGYVVLPPHLADAFRDRLGFYACTVGALEQLTLARFISSGQYERHVNRQRTSFRRIQETLVRALGATPAGEHLRFRNVGAGLHFLMEVEGLPHNAEDRIADDAHAKGVALAPLGRYVVHDRPTRTAAFVMSFASVDEGSISLIADTVSDAICAQQQRFARV